MFMSTKPGKGKLIYKVKGLDSTKRWFQRYQYYVIMYFPSVFWQKFCMHYLSSSCMLHVPTISSSLTCSS